jgi:crossover junction endodeoxyribonuclease RusA
MLGGVTRVAVTVLPVLTVRLLGEPAPQGSKNIGANGQLYESAARAVAAWRSAIVWQVRSAMRQQRHPGFYAGPVALDVVFFLVRGQTITRELPHVKPDVDKLLRSTLDGLTMSGVVKDDAQITTVRCRKRYGSPPGAGLRLGSDTGGFWSPTEQDGDPFAGRGDVLGRNSKGAK